MGRRGKTTVLCFTVLISVAVLLMGVCRAYADEGLSYEDFKELAATEYAGQQDPQHMWSSPSTEAGVSPRSSAYWTSVNGAKAFIDGRGNTYASPALKVVDVSSWQGNIDWQGVKSSDVDGAIVRLGYGVGNEDTWYRQNISECRRLGIPYGVYLYSYAYDVEFAKREAEWTATLLDRYGTAGMELPIYYDLEQWSWTGHTPPTDSATYSAIVRAYVETLASRGYTNVKVYSYTSYLNGPLNSPSIWEITGWVAQYNSVLTFSNPYYCGQYGWQYTSSGSVSGISGQVDLSAFSTSDYVDLRNLDLVTIPDGSYYINSKLNDSYGLSIMSPKSGDGEPTVLHSAGEESSQLFKFTRQEDGSYIIENEASGKVLDVYSSITENNAKVNQWTYNGSDAQKWFIRQGDDGVFLQSALGNWALDVNASAVANGTKITLYTPNRSNAQKFVICSSYEVPTNTILRLKSSLNEDMVMDVYSSSMSDGAKVQLYHDNGSDAQLFTFECVANGIYRLVNYHSDKAVEVCQNKHADGSKLQQATRSDNQSQHWYVVGNEDGTLSIFGVGSAKCIDVPESNAEDFAQLQVWSSNGTEAQRWVLEQGAPQRQRLDERAAEHAGDLPDGVYRISSSLGGGALVSVAGGSGADFANVEIRGDSGADYQLWSVSHDEQGYVTFTNVGTGKALDVYASKTSDGSNVDQYEPNGSYAQRWIAVAQDDGTYAIESSLARGLCLDTYASSTADGNNVQVWSSNGTGAQRWVVDVVR